ncbi:MAG TPA: DUF2314 domain-containing protein [Candidatus Binatia bacterium]|jgi:uncharacterized protein YegJ (DUF2314 family)
MFQRLSVVIKRLFGILAVGIGAGLILWLLYNLIWPTRYFRGAFQTPMQLAVPIVMISVGWRWLTDGGPGIEKQDIDIHSPEVLGSVAEAKRTLPGFIADVKKNIDGAYVKFPLLTDKGATEHIWAYVHHYADGVFNVSLANTPYTQAGPIESRRNVTEAEVEDWQIMLLNGRIRGAYSLRAAFRYLDRKKIRLNRTMRKQRSLLLDI